MIYFIDLACCKTTGQNKPLTTESVHYTRNEDIGGFQNDRCFISTCELGIDRGNLQSGSNGVQVLLQFLHNNRL